MTPVLVFQKKKSANGQERENEEEKCVDFDEYFSTSLQSANGLSVPVFARAWLESDCYERIFAAEYLCGFS
jgi:hypothetical protein